MTAPGALLATGNVAAVHVYGDRVLKLYDAGQPKTSPFREALTLALLEDSGLPVPRVHSLARHGDRWGIEIDRAAEAATAADWLRGDRAAAGHAAFAALQGRLHGVDGGRLPPLKPRLARAIRHAPDLPDAARADLLARLAAQPDGDRLCHGDFHPGNVLGPPERPLVIDWLDAACGDPAADLVRSYVLIHGADPAAATAHVAAYRALTPVPTESLAAWLPCIAAARLAETVPGGTRETLRDWALGARGFED